MAFMRNVNSGPLDRRAEIQYKSVTLDANYGTEQITWLPLLVEPGSPVVAQTTFASVREMAGAEAVRNGLDVASGPAEIVMRWIAGVDATMRVVVYDPVQVIYAIKGPPVMVGRQEGIMMYCERFSS